MLQFLELLFCTYWTGFFFFFLINLLIYFWLSWVFVAACRISLVAASGGYSSLRCVGFSLRRLLLLRTTGSRHTGFSSWGSRALELRLSSCGSRAQVLRGMWDPPGQGSNPCPLHWQADSQLLRHQGSPEQVFICWHTLKTFTSLANLKKWLPTLSILCIWNIADYLILDKGYLVQNC